MERTRTNTPSAVLTNDPSMTAWGWAVLKSNNVVDSGCIKTVPEHKKQRIRKSDDTARRATEIIKKLISIIEQYDVRFILSESPHGSQNASAAVMIGMVTGIVVAIAECKNIPYEMYSEQDSKKCALGRKAATKEDMIDCISTHYWNDGRFSKPWKTGIKYHDEAVADALAVHYCATQNSQLLKMLR